MEATADMSAAKDPAEVDVRLHGGQEAILFLFDIELEIVTKDEEKLLPANSGALTVDRPDNLCITLPRVVRRDVTPPALMTAEFAACR